MGEGQKCTRHQAGQDNEHGASSERWNVVEAVCANRSGFRW